MENTDDFDDADCGPPKLIIPEHAMTVWRADPRPCFEFSSDDMVELLGLLNDTVAAVATTIAKDLSDVAGQYLQGRFQKLSTSGNALTSRRAKQLVKVAEKLRSGLQDRDELFSADLARRLGEDILGVSGFDRIGRLMMDLQQLPGALVLAAKDSKVSKKADIFSTLSSTVSTLANLYETATGRAFTHSTIEYQKPNSEAGKFIAAFLSKVHGGRSLEHNVSLAKLIGTQANTIELNKALAATRKKKRLVK